MSGNRLTIARCRYNNEPRSKCRQFAIYASAVITVWLTGDSLSAEEFLGYVRDTDVEEVAICE